MYASSLTENTHLLRFINFFMLSLLLAATAGPIQAATSASAVSVSVENKLVRTGESFEVELYTSSLTGLNISAFDMTLTYDAQLLTPTAVHIEQTLSSDFTLISNFETPGRITVVGAGASALNGEGVLIRIEFQSLGSGQTALAFSELSFNEGDPAASGVMGQLTISASPLGDASLNGEISAFDAAKVLQHVALVETLSEEGRFAGDVSGNDAISAYDAALILQNVAGLIDCFPAESGCVGNKTSSNTQHGLAWGPVRIDGERRSLPLVAEAPAGHLHAITADFTLESGDATDIDIEFNAPADWLTTHRLLSNGVLRVTMAGATPASSDTLFAITAATEIHLSASYTTNENAPKSLESIALTETPESYALRGNYPNPFNPTTTIAYDLKQEVYVSLIVYDLLGREVARLVDGTQIAGQHNVSFDASSLSSGIYLYRLEAGHFSETRQMTLVK